MRLGVTVLAAGLLLAGSLWGTDDDFPFGPFSMYAGVNPPNEPAPDTRLEGLDAAGHTVILTENNAGVRRAEVEGNEARYVADPGLLAAIADAYGTRNPGAPTLVRVQVVVRLHEIHNSRITGRWRDEIRVSWERGP